MVFRSPLLSRSSTFIGNGGGKSDGRSSAWHTGSTSSLRVSVRGGNIVRLRTGPLGAPSCSANCRNLAL